MRRALTGFLMGLVLLATAAVAGGTEAGEMWYSCKYCGHKAKDVRSLTASACQRHPDGPGRGRHALYEGVFDRGAREKKSVE